MDIGIYPFPEAALQVLQLTFENVGPVIAAAVEKLASGGTAPLGPISPPSLGGVAGAAAEAEAARGVGRSRRASPV